MVKKSRPAEKKIIKLFERAQTTPEQKLKRSDLP